MKKTALLLLLCICLLLAGCTAQTAPQPIQPEPEPVPTEPEPTPPAAETADTVASQEEQTQERPALPVPSASMFSLTGREAVLYDAAVAQRYPRSDNDIVLPSLCVYGSFAEDGKTVVIVANLKPAKLMGIESNGMVLAASPDGGHPIVLNAEPAAPGTRVR